MGRAGFVRVLNATDVSIGSGARLASVVVGIMTGVVAIGAACLGLSMQALSMKIKITKIYFRIFVHSLKATQWKGVITMPYKPGMWPSRQFQYTDSRSIRFKRK